jgi:hypothetical protein
MVDEYSEFFKSRQRIKQEWSAYCLKQNQLLQKYIDHVL